MIALETAWVTVREQAEKAYRSKEKFNTPRNGVVYMIQYVTPSKITVHAEGENKSFGERALCNQLRLLNEAGGILHYRDFFQNVAKCTAVVHLHPQLGWDTSGQNVIDLKT